MKGCHNMNEKCAIWGGVLLGGLALAFFGSEALVEYYCHGRLRLGGSSAGPGSSGTGAVAVSANVSASSSSSSS